jgi:predicted ATP-grasp superfamily ATP-dependent carboligase
MKILVTQSSWKHSLGIIRSLALQGHKVYGLSETSEKAPYSRYSRYCKGIYIVNQIEEKAFLDEILSLFRKEHFDILVPVGFPVTHFVAKYSSVLCTCVRFAVPSFESEALAIDKKKICKFAQQLGVPVPRTESIESLQDINAIAKIIGTPLIIKGIREGSNRLVEKVDDMATVEIAYRDVIGKYSIEKKNNYPILQEYVPGWGCGFFASYDKGICKRTFMHRRIREFPPSGGVSCCARSFFDARLEEYGRKILDALKWHGVAMVEFRHDNRDGDYKLIEVNAKFWGSLELALSAGADFAGDYVKIALNKELSFQSSYKKITYQWILSGDLEHVLMRPQALFAFLACLFNPFVKKDIFKVSDPIPLLLQGLHLLKRLLSKGKVKILH